MLFAYLDAAQYLLRLGNYSHNSLTRSSSTFFAAPESANRLDEVKNGDLLFSHPTRSLVGWLVMYVTNSTWSHVATLTTTGTALEAVPRLGMVERPARIYFDGQHYLGIVRMGLSADDGNRVVAFGRSHLGAKYDLRGALRLACLFFFGATNTWNSRLIADVFFLLVIVSLLFYPSVFSTILLVISSLYACGLCINRRRWRRRVQREKMLMEQELQELRNKRKSETEVH